MLITNIDNSCFKGITKFLSCDSEGNHKKLSEYHYGSKSFGDTRGLSDFIQKHSYPFASIEETIGKIHNNKTYKVYIADPKEVVENSIKHSHDYIVYDLEPSFPDVRKKYFSPIYGSLEKEFQTVLEYYKRMENTATHKQDEEAAKTKQELVNNCKRIYAESAALRTEQEQLILKIKQRSEMINLVKSEAEKFSKELAVKKETIPRHKRSYEAKVRKLNNWLNKKALVHSDKKATPDIIEEINKKIKILTELKEALDIKIRHYEAKVVYWENYINNASRRIAEYSNDIINMKSRLKEIEQELKPNYEKLCEFYTLNGIKIIRRA